MCIVCTLNKKSVHVQSPFGTFRSGNSHWGNYHRSYRTHSCHFCFYDTSDIHFERVFGKCSLNIQSPVRQECPNRSWGV